MRRSNWFVASLRWYIPISANISNVRSNIRQRRVRDAKVKCVNESSQSSQYQAKYQPRSKHVEHGAISVEISTWDLRKKSPTRQVHFTLTDHVKIKKILLSAILVMSRRQKSVPLPGIGLYIANFTALLTLTLLQFIIQLFCFMQEVDNAQLQLTKCAEGEPMTEIWFEPRMTLRCRMMMTHRGLCPIRQSRRRTMSANAILDWK